MAEYSKKHPLKQKWYTLRKEPHVPEWDNFENFLKWCLENDWGRDDVLRRTDQTKPFGPRNCYWQSGTPAAESQTDAFIKKWNDTVNVIRKHFGFPPF